MTDLVERLRDRAIQFDSGYARDLMSEAATALEAKEKEIRAYQLAEGELRELLCSFVKQYCDPVPEWRPLEDLRGIISQFDNATTVVREFKARAETAERGLTNLLAIIHRDGGHYTEDHGLENSVKDAHLVWAKLQRERDEARAALKPFAAVAEHDIAGGETDDDYFQPMTKYNHAPRLRVGHLRAARAITGE